MLKKVSFFGFKSFADKVDVNFSNGITGVIGPNGCGKSNIFDGIRWVLGEQSAKSLRGGNMQDVIFAGSDTRKARDYAEVTLVLENKGDFFRGVEEDEVSVTRRTSRDGGSAYFINDEKARLKDIHDLFMDSGIGSNSYSMIGQGQIGKILSTKLEERRAIFEEAAGIVKLKDQKDKTEKRLKEVENNLVRIEDIVNELEKQLKPLEKQSEKAKEFNELNDELMTLEIQYLLNAYDKNYGKINVATNEIDDLKVKLQEVIETLNLNEETLTTSKENFQEKNDELFKHQNDASDLKEEIEKNNGEINLYNERINNSKKQILEIEENLKEIEEKFSLSTEDFKTKQIRLDDILTDVNKHEIDVEQINENISTFENEQMLLSNDLEHTRKESIDEYNDLILKKHEYEQLESRIDVSDKQLSSINNEINELSNHNEIIKNEFSSVDTDYNDFKNKYDELKIKLNAKNKEFERINAKKSDNLKLLQELETESIRQKSKLENLQNFVDNNEGFYDGVKSVLNEVKKGKFDGVYGAVAELVVVDKKHEIAIESLLQSSMQFLVTKNDTIAKDCINFLKDERKGRATFLPLNLANPYSFSNNEMSLINETQGIYLAIDSLSFDNQVAPVIKSLVGKSLIADNMDIALDFVKKTKIKSKISTVDGEIVQSGSISGGKSKHQKSNFFSKKRELEELKRTSEITEKDLNKRRLSNDNLKKMINTIEPEIKKYNDEEIDFKITLDEKYEELVEVKNKLERFNEKLQNLKVNQQEIKNNLNNDKKSFVKLKFIIESKEKKHEGLDNNFNSMDSKLKELSDELNDLKNSKTDIMLEINRLKEEERQLNSYLEGFNSDNHSLEDKINKLYNRKDEEENHIKDSKIKLGNLQNQNASLKEQMFSQQKIVDDLRNETQELQKNIDLLEKEIKDIRTSKEEKDKELNKKEVYLSKKETENKNITTRLFEGYEIPEDDIDSLERKEIEIDSSKKRITELKKGISKLGSINHNAIEEHEHLKERYDNEKTQLDDVKSAQKDLLSMIENVKTEMITRFTSTFDVISEKFSKIFVDLFEGGNAKLSLAEPSDPLNSAIEITAQPPGKKPASINSLSGGEKAFTAVALIFAIISSKPSPFIILDEVDAPLDDANVSRFAHYLDEFAKKSQFIVITHRKGTMHKCSTLIGITQEIPGTSIAFPHTLDDIDKKTS